MLFLAIRENSLPDIFKKLLDKNKQAKQAFGRHYGVNSKPAKIAKIIAGYLSKPETSRDNDILKLVYNWIKQIYMLHVEVNNACENVILKFMQNNMQQNQANCPQLTKEIKIQCAKIVRQIKNRQKQLHTIAYKVVSIILPARLDIINQETLEKKLENIKIYIDL